jgi:hypothetical protein
MAVGSEAWYSMCKFVTNGSATPVRPTTKQNGKVYLATVTMAFVISDSLDLFDAYRLYKNRLQ